MNKKIKVREKNDKFIEYIKYIYECHLDYIELLNKNEKIDEEGRQILIEFSLLRQLIKRYEELNEEVYEEPI